MFVLVLCQLRQMTHRTCSGIRPVPDFDLFEQQGVSHLYYTAMAFQSSIKKPKTGSQWPLIPPLKYCPRSQQGTWVQAAPDPRSLEASRKLS